MSILRTWAKAGTESWTLWDRGDELWEMRGDTLRHYAVVSRKMDGEIMREELRLMKDSPIPLEALRQEIQGWEVTEQVSVQSLTPLQQKKQQSPLPLPLLQPSQKPRAPRPSPRGPAFLPDDSQPVSQPSLPPYSSPESQSHTGPAKAAKTMTAKKATLKKEATHMPPESSLTQSSHETQPPLAPDSQEEQSSQQPCTVPAELWSSLSQWIPPSALFQPSLHHQAFLELSDTQALPYQPQRDSEKNLQRQQAQRQYVKQAQPSRPYHQRPSAHKIKVSSGPLFV